MAIDLMNLHFPKKGFTLLEVLVALVILGLVLGGLFTEIQSQIDMRYQLQQRYMAQTVSWNRLLQQYQLLEEWVPSRSDADSESSGDVQVQGVDWYWQMNVQETFGEDFYRYEVDSYRNEERSGNSEGSLAAYFIAE